MDSLMIELASRPQSSSSCLSSTPIQSDCPYLLHLDHSLLQNSTLHIIRKANKLIVCGLSTVEHYQTLLREVTVQWTEPTNIVTSRSEFKLRVYISDMNGVSFSTKTLTVQVQGIVQPQEEDEIGEETDHIPDTTETTSTHQLSNKKSNVDSSSTISCSVNVLICIVLASLSGLLS